LLSVGESLVVEDELLVLMMIEGMLADIGCDCVTAAATVDKALALIGAQVCDTAMLDMNLNGATGHSVAEALVARGLPFCLLHSQQRLHFAYRRCCRLDLADKVPDHSTFSVNRHARFRHSGARHPGSHLL
jgi:DNA-binding NarL/FixJ family response regulator